MSSEKLDRAFTTEEKSALLNVARNAINKAVGNSVVADESFDSPIFHEKRGAFVTLHNDGALRGCIGYVLAFKPLIETVREMAVAAALRDPRFASVDSKEVAALQIEISALSPLYEIKDIEDIKVGIHGLYIQHGHKSGLLLPQVATEYNWDRLTFLQQTCRKAGLSEDAWQHEESVIKIFSAQVFAED
jgi:AmmeMemoRadiSam system protein A